ncbi:MAG TPA: FISUMP domain-containing protein [Fibrobacteraceae bacterium]|nr:FISUMP domain-containing protein [Fibrobacteraceae bacterium]
MRFQMNLVGLFPLLPLFSCSDLDLKPADEVTASWSSSRLMSSSSGVTTYVTDARDNQFYEVVVIGTQTWMKHNLNYSGDDGAGNKVYTMGWCYGVGGSDTSQHQDSATCETYGRLYSWTDAMDLSNDTASIGSDLKMVSSLWDSYASLSNTDAFGFSALPGGSRYSDAEFDDLGTMPISGRHRSLLHPRLGVGPDIIICLIFMPRRSARNLFFRYAV